MTRELNCAALDLKRPSSRRSAQEAPDEADALLAGFVERGEVALKGREQPVAVLAYGKRRAQNLKP